MEYKGALVDFETYMPLKVCPSTGLWNHTLNEVVMLVDIPPLSQSA
jgi:hypothetical protein